MSTSDPTRAARILGLVDTTIPVDQPKRRFHSGQELFETAPETVPWVWHGYLATGVVTLFAGRHKGGKSTLLFQLMQAISEQDDSFLGHEIDGTRPVILLTEEGPETLRSKLEPFTENGRERLRVMCRNDVTPRGDYGWVNAIRDAGLEALAYDASTVIIDTYAFWSQVQDENNNSLVQETVAALGELTSQQLAVLIVHHHRKGGGEDGDAIRGGTSLQGAVDIITELIRPAGKDDDDETTERELRAIGRFTETPEAMRIAFDSRRRYRTLGEGTKAQMKAMSTDARILTYLRELWPGTATRKEVEEAVGLTQATANRSLLNLTKIGDLSKFDDGPRGGHRYRFERGTALEPFPQGPTNAP